LFTDRQKPELVLCVMTLNKVVGDFVGEGEEPERSKELLTLSSQNSNTCDEPQCQSFSPVVVPDVFIVFLKGYLVVLPLFKLVYSRHSSKYRRFKYRVCSRLNAIDPAVAG
jgi:hypothetical protein